MPRRKKLTPLQKWENRGIDLREFTGRSWKDLQDVWPRDLRLAKEAWKIVSVIMPAFLATVGMVKELTNGGSISLAELALMAWVLRCEEVREELAADPDLVTIGVGIRNRKLLAKRMMYLVQHKMMETIGPGNKQLVRLTPLGRMVISKFVDSIEQAHYDIREWRDQLATKSTVKAINNWMGRACWDYEEIIFHLGRTKGRVVPAP